MLPIRRVTLKQTAGFGGVSGGKHKDVRVAGQGPVVSEIHRRKPSVGPQIPASFLDPQPMKFLITQQGGEKDVLPLGYDKQLDLA